MIANPLLTVAYPFLTRFLPVTYSLIVCSINMGGLNHTHEQLLKFASSQQPEYPHSTPPDTPNSVSVQRDPASELNNQR